MENTMKYPDAIYTTSDGGTMFVDYLKNTGAGWGRRHAYEVGYGKGMTRGMISQLSKPDPLEGHSNLTEAIQTGKPIDWDKMKGVKVKCVNPSIGTLRGELKRNTAWSENSVAGWYRRDDVDHSYAHALVSAWNDEDGWTLWIDGEIPLRLKTADQLPDYTYFLGKSGDGKTYLLYTGCPLRSGTIRNIYYAPEMMRSFTPASEWEVLEEYGTFQKPEGK